MGSYVSLIASKSDKKISKELTNVNVHLIARFVDHIAAFTSYVSWLLLMVQLVVFLFCVSLYKKCGTL